MLFARPFGLAGISREQLWPEARAIRPRGLATLFEPNFPGQIAFQANLIYRPNCSADQTAFRAKSLAGELVSAV
jgi:hypothetical protein